MKRTYKLGQRSRAHRLFTPERCKSYGCTKYTNMSHGLCSPCIGRIRNQEKQARKENKVRKYAR